MKFQFPMIEPPPNVLAADWMDWRWQMRQNLKTKSDFAEYFELSANEREALDQGQALFQIRTTPYYARLADSKNPEDPIRQILMPSLHEANGLGQQLDDPLGEKRHRPTARVVHRYPDRVLFWLTDQCSVYCRYCTRKHFTASNQSLAREKEIQDSIDYISKHAEIREVIFSGGDPLTVSDDVLIGAIERIQAIPHVELIRIGTRMPTVCPMRITDQLVQRLEKFHPIFFMTHFNHPREITKESSEALLKLVDNGFPVMNQLVLLNGINNHPAIVQALSRRLLSLRVKPYYMFQCDPSVGTDHLRTTIENSEWIQKELWGRLSGLAMPTLSLDIPEGGGKVGLVPQFETARSENERLYKGWDGIEAPYINPASPMKTPIDTHLYEPEWNLLKASR